MTSRRDRHRAVHRAQVGGLFDNSVYYARPNGLMQVSSQGLTRLTNQVLTREEWPRFISA